MLFKVKRFTPLALSLAIFLGLLSLLNITQAATLPEVSGPSINRVSPSLGCNDRDTWVYIYGDGFTEPLTVTLNNRELTIKDVQHDRVLIIVPAEMTPALYDLTVQTEEDTYTRLRSYNMLEPTPVDDLTSHAHWLWTNPAQLQVEGPINRGVGLNVQRLGGCQKSAPLAVLKNVSVEFVLELPTGTHVLGRSDIPELSPTFIETTPKVIWEPEEPGLYSICAIIDPDNEIEETDETNNRICRTVTVSDNSEPDITAPVVHELVIEDDATDTTQITVTLDVEAEDMEPDPRSGVDMIKFVEYEYNFASGYWVPVQQPLWVNYEIAEENYPWTLIQTYGVRYIDAKAIDKAGNISLDSAIDFINLLPTAQSGVLEQDGADFYRIYVNAGDTLSATLTPIWGDSDLHIWGPDNLYLSSLNDGTSVDFLIFPVPETGIYQIEIHAHSDASYRLIFEVYNNTSAIEFRGFDNSSKTDPDAPMVRLDNYPGNGSEGNENYDVTRDLFIYLPLTTR